MTIRDNLASLLKTIAETAQSCGRKPEEVKMVAVSKGRPLGDIQEAYEAGCRDFGESRVQEALLKMEQAPQDIRWHFIGKLQKNKVNKVIGRFELIHSVDTVELAEKIGRASLEQGIKTAILLEANTSGEKTKSGLSPAEWEAVFDKILILPGIEIKGLMTLAPLTDEEEIIRHAFSELRLLRDRLNALWKGRTSLSILSMGMTHDFCLAIQEGASIVRIGRGLWN